MSFESAPASREGITERRRPFFELQRGSIEQAGKDLGLEIEIEEKINDIKPNDPMASLHVVEAVFQGTEHDEYELMIRVRELEAERKSLESSEEAK